MYAYMFLSLLALAQANPVELGKRQGVTAIIAPPEPLPPGCGGSVDYRFGIMAHNVSTSAVAKRAVASQITDGQVQAASGVSPPAHQITDGQIQVPTGVASVAPSQTKFPTMAAISMITDGQIQGGMHTMVMMPVANQITDGQVQVQTKVAPVTEFSDGQPQAPTVAAAESKAAVAQKTDGQPVATTSAASAASASPSSSTSLVQCATGFSIELKNHQLFDQNGRTGYIASNFQLQFDKPPQAGALFTSGFSICSNGSLALGAKNVFYQCRSGSFFNLYDRSWAAQCSPVTIETLREVNC